MQNESSTPQAQKRFGKAIIMGAWLLATPSHVAFPVTFIVSVVR